MKVEVEIQTLIYENSSEDVIYTDGSVVLHAFSLWASAMQVRGHTVHKNISAFPHTINSMIMEIMVVTKAVET
jgi:hypothetical protein